MPYSKEAHELLDEALEVLKEKKGKLAWPFMVGLLMPNVGLSDAKNIVELINNLPSEVE